MPQETVQTQDGHQLAATTFGDAREARAAVLIVPAMGVNQSFYAAFARWLSDRGFYAVTFDYRGVGRSRPETYRASLRGFDTDITTWALQDCAAMVEFAALHGKPLLWIGHSLGAQIFGLVPNRGRVAGMVTIAAGSGYWLQNSPALRTVAWWLWYVAVPLAVRVCGYFPGRRLRKVGDLPAGVILQWRRWCLNREYMVGAEDASWRSQYAAIHTPILSLSFTDDEFMSGKNIASLHSFYADAPQDTRRLRPRDVGQKSIGHFGFFRPRFEASLWPQVAGWMEAHMG